MNGPKPYGNDEADKIKAKNAWRAVCAKLGMPESAEVSNGSGLTLQQCHEQRKLVRQAVNKLHASLGVRNPSEEEGLAFAHAGYTGSQLNDFIENLEGRQNQARGLKDMKVLRSQGDFE